MGVKAHTYAPAYIPSEFDEVLNYSSHITFNSLNQLEQFKAQVLAHTESVSIGLRVNPEYSVVEVDLYNPASPTSRLGVTAKDVDAAIARPDLPTVVAAAEAIGWRYRRAAGVDMLVDAQNPRARSAVHLLFLNEKVRPDYLEAIPDSVPVVTREGIPLAPVSDIVRMKLTSHRLKDQVHIQDLDSVGLITPEIEAGLPEFLRERLSEIRAKA